MCKKGKIMNYDSAEYKKKCRGVRNELSKRGIKYRIYHVKEDNSIITTICIGKLPSGECVRGISICSAEDNFCKAVGQYYSMVRAIQSAVLKHDVDEVNRHEVFDRYVDGIPTYKGFYNIALTQGEEEMFGESA